MAKLDKISLRGFKSIEKLEDFELGSLNVLIGANGSGKSNFVEFFRMLRAMVEQRFQLYVARNGPSDGFFYNGVSYTKQIDANLTFGSNQYAFRLEPTADGKIIISEETTRDVHDGTSGTLVLRMTESSLTFNESDADDTWEEVSLQIRKAISKWEVYHFHDTSMTAGMRRDIGINQTDSLRSDASNLAAFLLWLRTRHANHYKQLRKTLQRVAPYFDDFELRVTDAELENLVRLTWRQKESNYVFSPGHFSDGTIRFLCLATALTQPDPPTTIVLDEPELGLHPEALSVLAGLVRSASTRMQIILATQSPVLLNEFEPEQIITVDQKDGATQFNRLNAAALDDWLNDFTLGELWQKGTIRGGVNHA